MRTVKEDYIPPNWGHTNSEGRVRRPPKRRLRNAWPEGKRGSAEHDRGPLSAFSDLLKRSAPEGVDYGGTSSGAHGQAGEHYTLFRSAQLSITERQAPKLSPPPAYLSVVADGPFPAMPRRFAVLAAGLNPALVGPDGAGPSLRVRLCVRRAVARLQSGPADGRTGFRTAVGRFGY
jgi:hypothetical protein